MKNIKLFEAFSEEYYKKALDNIKALVNKDAPKEDILNYISKFTSEDAKL